MEFRTIAITCLMLLAGCNYTEGPCWRRGEGGAFGGVGGSVTVGVGAGVGGFGVSPEPQSLGDEPECNISDAPEPSGERCRRECQEAKDDRDAICRGLPTRKAREKCWRSSNEQYAECVKKCKAGPQ